MNKRLSPVHVFLQRFLVFLLFLIFTACGTEPEVVSDAAVSEKGVDSLTTAVPAEAEPTPEELVLPAYSDKETLLSRELDPTERYLAMVFEEEIEDDFAQNKTHIRFYRRENSSDWVAIDSVILFEEGRKCFSISPAAFLPLGEQSGFFVETEAGRMGTANAGLTERDYIFYVPGTASASVYRYVKWQRKEGKLEEIRRGSGDFRVYIKQSQPEEEGEKTELENFQKVWLVKNQALYEQMDKKGSWNAIQFPVFSKGLMDSLASDNIVQREELTVQGGFANPVLAYSSKAEKTFVLWIPAGWPNGGGWGARSLYVEEVSPAGHITVSNRDDIHLLFDVPRQRVMFLDTLPYR